MSIAKKIFSNPYQTGLIKSMEEQAIRECVSDKAIGEFGSGEHEYKFSDGSKLVFSGEDERKVTVR